MSVYQPGPNTLAVPMTLFKENREKVISELRKQPSVAENSLILLQGGSELPIYSSDTFYLFRQVSAV